MMFLVLYSTVEGHTRKIANNVAKTLEKMGHEVFLTEASDPGFCDPATYDAAVLCAPIHIGRYPSDFVSYINDWKSSMREIPTALITVSLAIASEDADEQTEAISYPEALISSTGWLPDFQHNAAGALKFVEYNFFKRWIMRRIAQKEAGPIDTTRDHELTDWPELEKFTAEFARHSANVSIKK